LKFVHALLAREYWQMIKEKNYGYIHRGIPPSADAYGGSSSFEREGLFKDLNVLPILTKIEPQSYKYFDAYWCVTTSFQKIIQQILKVKYGINIDFSEQYSASLNGTVNKKGNDFESVYQHASTIDGMVSEVVFPDVENPIIWEDVCGRKISDPIKKEGIQFIKDYHIQREYIPVYSDRLWEEFDHSPIQISWYFSAPDADGIIRYKGKRANHASWLIRGEYKKYHILIDSIPQFPNDSMIRKIDWNYHFDAAAIYNITLNKNLPINLMNLKENALYQLVQDKHGGAFIRLGDRVYHDTESKIQYTWIMRNTIVKEGISRFEGGETGTIIPEMLNGLEIFNLKNEKIGVYSAEKQQII
jgi:hypothetical protein